MSRREFKIMYPTDHHDPHLAGTEYKVLKPNMIVMNKSGIMFVFNGEQYYPSIRPLRDCIDRYDVIWKQ